MPLVRTIWASCFLDSSTLSSCSATDLARSAASGGRLISHVLSPSSFATASQRPAISFFFSARSGASGSFSSATRRRESASARRPSSWAFLPSRRRRSASTTDSWRRTISRSASDFDRSALRPPEVVSVSIAAPSGTMAELSDRLALPLVPSFWECQERRLERDGSCGEDSACLEAASRLRVVVPSRPSAPPPAMVVPVIVAVLASATVAVDCGNSLVPRCAVLPKSDWVSGAVV